MNNNSLRILLLTSILIMLMAIFLSGCEATSELPASAELATKVMEVVNTPTPTPAPTSTPTPTPTPHPTSTPTPMGPKATATPETLIVIISEAQANEMAQQALANQSEIQIDHVKVDFRADEMYLSGDTKIGFFTLNIGLLVDVTAKEGKAEISIKEIYVNDSPATGFIRNEIERLIAPQLANLKLVEEQFFVESVTISPDKLIITGHYK